MPEVQNVGAADYAQYQPSQYQYDNYAVDYNTQPAVYDEANAEIKAASKSHLGATILTSAIIGGLALWGGRAWGKKSAAAEIEKLTDAANSKKSAAAEIEKLTDAANKYKDFVEKNAKELEEEADKIINSDLGGYKYGKKFAQKVKNEVSNLRKVSEEVKNAGEKIAEKANEGAKEAAEEGVKKAE